MLYGMFSWAVWSAIRFEKRFRIKDFFVAGIIIGVCFYTDVVVSVVLCGFAVLFMLARKRFRNMCTIILGMAIAIPQLFKFLNAILTGVWDEQMISLVSIMPTGYTLGRFFSHYYFVKPMPGLGISFISLLALLVWRCILTEKFPWEKDYGCILVLVGMAMVLSLEKFPWDMVQRVHPVFLRFVSMIKELNLFVGIMNMGLALFVIPVFEDIKRSEKKQQTMD